MIAAELVLLTVFVAAVGASLLPKAWRLSLKNEAACAERWCLLGFTAIAGGFLAHYAALLVAGRFGLAIAAGLACVAVRVAAEIQAAKASQPSATVSGGRAAGLRSPRDWWSVAGWLLLALLLAVLGFWTLAVPIAEWDPKSIWFFHAKIMYFAGGLFGDSGWDNPHLRISHPDYPKMMTALAAQAAWVSGYWNDYITKLPLVTAQLAVVLGLAAAARSRFEAALLVCGIVIFHAASYTTGYMDVYVAAFAAVAALMLGRAVLGAEQRFFLPGVLACALLPGLKNEGYVIALIILAVMGGARLMRPVQVSRTSALRRVLPTLALAFLPAVMWALMRGTWGINSSSSFGPEYWGRVELNLSGPVMLATLDELGRHGKILSSGFLLLVSGVFLQRLPPVSAACAVIGIVYTMALIMVYLGSSYEVVGHLETSASRTALAIQAVLYAGAACALNELARQRVSR